MTELPPPHRQIKTSARPFVGMIGMACVLFLIGASVLAAPWFVVAALVVVWLAVLFVSVAWWSLHPSWLPWLPVGLTVVWFGTVVGGAFVFGWSA